MLQQRTLASLSFLFILLLVPHMATAQEEEAMDEPAFVMLNQHQCYGQYLDEVAEMVDAELAPTLDALVEEGHIMGWGVLQHAWGDEWNWNFYIITESHADFLDAWGEFAERTGNPYETSDFGEWCFAHKDNMYILTDWG